MEWVCYGLLAKKEGKPPVPHPPVNGTLIVKLPADAAERDKVMGATHRSLDDIWT
jgi:hypothetical protein